MPPGSASPKVRFAAAAAAFAALYFLAAELTSSLVDDAGIAVLWPASGVYLGVMLVAPRQLWGALALGAGLGSLAAYSHAGSSLELSVAFAVPSSAEGLLAAVLVERLARGRFTLGGLHDVSALAIGGLVATALVALSAGAVAAQTFDASFADSWLRWWSADALGILAVTPIITAPLRAGRRGHARLWSPARVAALGGLALGIVAMQLVSHGSDLVSGAGDVGDQVYMVQGFLAVLQVVSLALAVSVTERERLQDELGTELDGSVERLDDARRRVAQLNAELAGRRAELVQTERRSERTASELRESEAARRRAERELGHTKSALTVSQQELDELRRDLGLTTADRDRVQGELDASAEAAKRAGVDLSRAAEELSRARADSRAHKEQLERARAETGALEAELERARAETGALEAELERARAETDALQGELERASAESGALQAERERANEFKARARAEQDALQRELGNARASGRALHERLERAEASATEQAQELEAARAATQALRQSLERARVEKEDELAAVAGRVEGLERELERTRRAHRDAELALEHARARFNERRERLERSLGEAGREVARPPVAERAPELSSRYDERGVCQSVSPGFAALLGYEAQELIGRPGAELLHPEDLPRLARARALRAPSRFEARLRRKSGGFVLVEVSLEPVWSSAYGKLVSLTTTVREIGAGRVAA